MNGCVWHNFTLVHTQGDVFLVKLQWFISQQIQYKGFNDAPTDTIHRIHSGLRCLLTRSSTSSLESFSWSYCVWLSCICTPSSHTHLNLFMWHALYKQKQHYSGVWSDRSTKSWKMGSRSGCPFGLEDDAPWTSWMFNYGGFRDSPQTRSLDTIHTLFLFMVATSILSRKFWGQGKFCKKSWNQEKSWEISGLIYDSIPHNGIKGKA